MTPNQDEYNAYATLLTRPSYLAGAILLAYTLHNYSPATPLLILYTPDTFPEAAVKALQDEGRHSNAIAYPIEHLRLPKGEDGDEKHSMVAERFIDTWTKLRVFDILEVNGRKIDRLCFLDADMMIFSNPSPHIFNQENDNYLQGQDGLRICASHVCVCNLDGDSWAPKTWTKENCAYTSASSAEDIPAVRNDPETMGMFNSGTFVFHPSPAIRDFVIGKFQNTSPKDLRAMKFPDQDFLNEAFHRQWSGLSWKTNALKTWRYWHTNFWRDDKVAVLHYIVDKPWAALVQEDEQGQKKAGYKGDDGETHSWWWIEYQRWFMKRQQQGEMQLLNTVNQYVASKDGKDNDEFAAIGGGAQSFAKKWKDGKEVPANEDQREDDGQVGGQPLRKPMLGERGHGPVVRGRGKGLINPNGRSQMDP